MGRQTADPLALAIARAAQDAAPDAVVILFGSRARGDHRPDSDVDLLVIADDNAESDRLAIKTRASRAAHQELMSGPPSKIGIDVISMYRSKFDYFRTAKTHVAAQALRDGVIMQGDAADFPPLPPDDDSPTNWPDVRQRILNANRWLGSMNVNIDVANYDQELIGFIAQQSVENALKGWIAAIDCEYWNIHDVVRLADVLFDNVPPNTSPARDVLDDLIAYVMLPPELLARRRPHEPRDWLTDYAVEYRYGGAEHRLDPAGYQELKTQINRAVTTIVAHIHQITAITPADLNDPTSPGQN